MSTRLTRAERDELIEAASAWRGQLEEMQRDLHGAAEEEQSTRPTIAAAILREVDRYQERRDALASAAAKLIARPARSRPTREERPDE